MSTIAEFATNMGRALVKVPLTEFFCIMHNRFYQDGNAAFMMFYIEMLDHEDEFFVHHSNLARYGVTSATTASGTRKRMIAIGLIEGIDYQMCGTSDDDAGVRYGYKLTPAAFRTCLFRANHNRKTAIDPVCYAQYYLCLEKTYHMFTLYERAYADALTERDAQHIESLISIITDLENEIWGPVDISCLDTENIDYASMDWY
jgi:hypothetical protein